MKYTEEEKEVLRQTLVEPKQIKRTTAALALSNEFLTRLNDSGLDFDTQLTVLAMALGKFVSNWAEEDREQGLGYFERLALAYSIMDDDIEAGRPRLS